LEKNQRKLKLYHLWMLMAQTVDAALKLRERELRQYNISRRESAVLYIIHATDNHVTPATISRYLARQSHSISELLDRMEKKGLVTRAKDLDKKNLVRIVLTEKGEQAYSCSTRIESFLESIGLSHRSIWPGTH